MDLLEIIAMICTADVVEIYETLNETISNEAANVMIKVVYPFKKIFSGCEWMLDYTSECNKFFSPVITEDGICYSFNMLPISQIFSRKMPYDLKNYSENFYSHENKSFLWSQDKGYPNVVPGNVFPKRVEEAVSKMLELFLVEDKSDVDYLCNGMESGYKVIVHNPRDFPNTFFNSFKLSFNKKYMFNIKPVVLTTSRNLQAYSPKYRQCYYDSEKNLTFFQYYSKQNCELECLTNYTLQLCGCVSFYMPRNDNVKVCGPGKISCLETAKVRYLSLDVTTGIYPAESKGEILESKNLLCECLPECNSLNYETEIIQHDYLVQPVIERLVSVNKTALKNIQAGNLIFNFKEMRFVKGKRKLLYGFADLLANCGGLFSLFTGFSLVSLVELIYFCTLRIFCNFRRYGAYLWAGKKEA